MVRTQVGGKSALVAHVGRVATVLQHLLQGMEDLGAHAQTVGKCFRSNGHDHEFLDVNLVVRVRTSVEDVHHRNGQCVCIDTTDIAVQRLTSTFGRGVGSSQ